jgi:hypothetical protein
VAAALIGVPGLLGVRAQGRRRGCAAGMEAGCGSVRAHGWLGRGEGDDRRATPGSETRGKAVEWAGWANWASKRRAACLIRRWAEGGLAGLRGGFGPEAKKEKGKKKTFAIFKRAHKI